MTGRSLAIASSTRRTDLRRPTSMGMIAPGNSTELRRGRIGSVSGISTGCSPPALALVIDRNLASGIRRRQGDLPVMTGGSPRPTVRCRTMEALTRPPSRPEVEIRLVEHLDGAAIVERLAQGVTHGPSQAEQAGCDQAVGAHRRDQEPVAQEPACVAEAR